MSEYNPETAGLDVDPTDLRASRPLIGDAATLPAAAPQEGFVDVEGEGASDDPAVEGGTRAP
jgi:hypothetical protein